VEDQLGDFGTKGIDLYVGAEEYAAVPLEKQSICFIFLGLGGYRYTSPHIC
jgi:hypothetical protein